MGESKLNKQLWTDVNRLKRLNATSDPKFLLDKSPFDEDEDNGGSSTASATRKEDLVILGRILPDAEVYKEGAYQIEMKLTPTFPFDPPAVRFLTKIYHPNVSEQGEFCHELLKKTARWTNQTSLVDIIKAVIEHIDKPNIDYSLSLSLGREYMENRPEFDRKALEYVKKYSLPRS